VATRLFVFIIAKMGLSASAYPQEKMNSTNRRIGPSPVATDRGLLGELRDSVHVADARALEPRGALTECGHICASATGV